MQFTVSAVMSQVALGLATLGSLTGLNRGRPGVGLIAADAN
jgi:hypothetical protein